MQMDYCAYMKMVSSLSSSAGLAVATPCKFSYGCGVASFGFRVQVSKDSALKIRAIAPNGSVSASKEEESNLVRDVHRQMNSVESLFCYDKPIPEQIIEKPVGISLAEKAIGDKPRCTDCEAKGAVLCATCSGSGLYVDSIMESQGIIVKVRCIGCGGTGNIMCSECAGQGHIG